MRSLERLLRWRLGLVRIEPWAREGETACLCRHAANKRRLAEIGVWEGGSTRALRQVMAPDGVLFAVDPFPKGRLGISYQRPIARGEAARVRHGEIVWIRREGAAAASDPRVAAAPFDFVFLDADHTYDGTRAVWEAWQPLVGDVVALHDAVGPADQGSVRFVNEQVVTDARFTVLDVVGCLMVLRRR